MTAKVFLMGYLDTKKRCVILQAEIDSCYALAQGCTAVITPNKVSSSSCQDRMAQAVMGAVDAKARLQREHARLESELDRILQAIDAIPDQRQKNVLTLRYIRGKKWFEICNELNFERTQVWKLHGKALQHVQAWMVSHLFPP